MKKVAIVGSEGYVGKAYQKVFPESVRYDEPLNIGNRKEVNECDIALVCVPTNAVSEELDMNIVEEVVGWIETPLILIKSALQPGTVDRLVKKTGKKIAVSVELVGESKYATQHWKYPHPTDPRMHQTIIVGGEEPVAFACAEYLWDKMSPDIQIHIVSALEAEITKLTENFFGALKVTWINSLYSLTEKSGANFIKVQQAWQSDPRVNSMHMRTISWKRGWVSRCWDKDVPALKSFARQVGAKDLEKLADTVLELNRMHLKENSA